MKIYCSLTDFEFDKIKNSIQATDWGNPIEGEYVFYDPSERFFLLLALTGIVTYKDISDDANKYITDNNKD